MFSLSRATAADQNPQEGHQAHGDQHIHRQVRIVLNIIQSFVRIFWRLLWWNLVHVVKDLLLLKVQGSSCNTRYHKKNEQEQQQDTPQQRVAATAASTSGRLISVQLVQTFRSDHLHVIDPVLSMIIRRDLHLHIGKVLCRDARLLRQERKLPQLHISLHRTTRPEGWQNVEVCCLHHFLHSHQRLQRFHQAHGRVALRILQQLRSIAKHIAWPLGDSIGHQPSCE
mmetsp:Transcript_69459/g.153256  ORF Transcript_69459/g.153256 Transcript_69459/m.153256 type:complete len:226 (+) Transcript_69459:273-950(+)